MGALLAVATFVLFIVLDYLLSRRAAARKAVAGEGAALPAGALAAAPVLAGGGVPEAGWDLEPVWVAGFELPEGLHYHRGHVWARVVAPDTVAVGIDDLARRLVGRATGIRLPAVGSSLQQGGKGAEIEAGDRAADVLSPVDGEVVAVNGDLGGEPALATADPYRRGWLYRVRSPNLPVALRNLLSGSLARRWAQDAREQLDLRLMALSGSVLQDGGEPAHDFGQHLEGEDWKGLVEAFLLTEGHLRPEA